LPKFVEIGQTVSEILRFFDFCKMAAVAILDLQNFKVGGLKRVKLRRPAKFGRNRSNCCRDMAIFYFSKMAEVRHLEFVVWVFGPPTKGA